MSASITRIPNPVTRNARARALGQAMTDLLEGLDALRLAADSLALPEQLLSGVEHSIDTLWDGIDRCLSRG